MFQDINKVLLIITQRKALWSPMMGNNVKWASLGTAQLVTICIGQRLEAVFR